LTPGNVLIIFAGLTAFIIITGTYPGIYISKYTINSNKERLTGHSGHNGIRIGLIIFQNLVSITLICCTLIASQQFRYISKKDLGFSKNDIVNLKINSQFKEHLELFKEKLSRYPEIKNISYSSRVPGSYWGSWCCVNIEGNENKFFNNYVDPEYLGTLGIVLKEGRNFSADDPGDMRATYLINETAVKQYDLKNPIGQFITPGNGKKGQIIGVIKDFHYRGLNYEKTPLLLFYTPDYVNYVNIKVDNNNIRMALNRIETTWNEICPAFAFEYSFLDQTYDLQYKSEKRFETLLLSFAILALFIASIGLFGLSIYSTGRRIKEIGIRKINGARVFEIIAMLNTDLVKWVIIAYFIACPIAWYAMYKWLQSFAYKTDLKLWIFALAGLLASGIAILTVSWQSWRAATRNPVAALRYE
jgi:putative ABC transport system permease protein